MKRFFLLISFLIFTSGFADTIPKEKNYRTYFIVSEAAQGTTVYSWLLPSGLGLKGKGAVALGLWTPALFFLGSYPIKYVRSEGTPLQCYLGGIGGMVRGLFLYPKDGNPYTFSLFLSLGENIGGYFLSEKMKFGLEDAWRFLNFNLLGYAHAGMFNIFTQEKWEDFRYLYPLFSAIEGYGGSILLHKEDNITFGDAFAELEYMRLGITSPLSFFGGIQLLSEKSISKKIYVLSSFTGSLLGTYFGHQLSKKRDLTFGQALLISFAPRIIEGMILGTTILVAKDFTKREWGITLLLISISDPIGTLLFDKIFTSGL
jgi:hypothetical protein